MRPSTRLAIGALAALALAGAFFLYTRPDFLVQLANQVWACF
ncbi:hypothetical protein [uncultured Rhodoferax sp.]|nr:hypothetical protein [uncultured Rhodoferax sp.]